jgi:hypothetical protein
MLWSLGNRKAGLTNPGLLVLIVGGYEGFPFCMKYLIEAKV